MKEENGADDHVEGRWLLGGGSKGFGRSAALCPVVMS